jgi:hypothetical protein
MDYSAPGSRKSKPTPKRKAEDVLGTIEERPKTRRSRPDEDKSTLTINQPIRKPSGASMTRYNVYVF